MHQTVVWKCASCGAPVSPPTGTGSVTCPYCGTLIAPASGPDSARASGDAHYQRGIDAYAQARYSEAVNELEQALRLGVTQHPLAAVYTALGDGYDDLHNYDRAIEMYRVALRLDAQHYKAWVGMGVAHRHRGDLVAAQECYQEALRIEPRYAALHASLGALYLYRGELDKACASLDEALRLDASLAAAHANLALARAMDGRFAEADASLKHAVALGYRGYAELQERIQALKRLAGS